MFARNKVFATQDGRTNTTDYIDQYVTHMDQKYNRSKYHLSQADLSGW